MFMYELLLCLIFLLMIILIHQLFFLMYINFSHQSLLKTNFIINGIARHNN